MPAPASRTRPTASRSTEGLYFSIALRRASAIACGSKVSSAMASGAPQALPCVFETGPDGPVEHLVAHPGKDAADHRGIDHHLDLHVLARGLGERLRQLLAPLLAERDRLTHLRDALLAPLRGHRDQSLGVAPHDLVLGGHYPFPFPDPDTCLMNSSTSFCWVVLSSSFSTTRSASSTAIWPTWAESSRSTRSRSARISSVARATVARASCSAFPWRSARSCSAVFRPSSMIRFASSRALPNCSLYRVSSASASRPVASARSRSPWTFSLRLPRMALTLGRTHFPLKPNRMANAIAPTMSSEAWG